jgi:hypothetical protein
VEKSAVRAVIEMPLLIIQTFTPQRHLYGWPHRSSDGVYLSQQVEPTRIIRRRVMTINEEYARHRRQSPFVAPCPRPQARTKLRTSRMANTE